MHKADAESRLRLGMQGNTLESRRQLRSDLENEGLRLAREFIEEFSDIEHVRVVFRVILVHLLL